MEKLHIQYTPIPMRLGEEKLNLLVLTGGRKKSHTKIAGV